MAKATKTMTPKKPRMKLDGGIGFDQTVNDDGYGLKNTPAVAIASHPIRGLRIYGPFLNGDAARLWIDREGDGDLLDCGGSAREWVWIVECLDVPRSYRD